MAKKNYNYGRIVDGRIVYAPNKLTSTMYDDEGNPFEAQVINGTAEHYASEGWLPIRKATPPSYVEGGSFIPEYSEHNGEIVKSFRFVPSEPAPAPLTPSESERLEALEDAFLELVMEKEGSNG